MRASTGGGSALVDFIGALAYRRNPAPIHAYLLIVLLTHPCTDTPLLAYRRSGAGSAIPSVSPRIGSELGPRSESGE
eukprot:15450552-Alexandrium_andersonii.AAC.1